MSAIDELFQKLRSEGRKALMPFITAGDPDLEYTAALLRELSGRGAEMFEVGFPYSDPIADGPVVQASYTRALERGITLPEIFTTLGQTTGEVQPPVVGMVSYAIIFRRGVEAFCDAAVEAGLAGLIVPDLPWEESSALAKPCGDRDLSLIQLVTPTTPRDRAVRICDTSTGFVYYVSVTGITGERTQLPPELADNVSWLREQTELPICIGFGISQPEHVRLLAPAADGLIVGSAIVRRLADFEKTTREEKLAEIGDFVASLVAAMP